MKSVNKNLQDYFVKIAPDFSVFDMVEKYYYDNNLSTEYFKEVFSYKVVNLASYSTNFYRGMFLVYTSGDITINAPEDEYVVFPMRYYMDGLNKVIISQIIIAIQEAPFVMTSTSNIDLVIGVAF